LSRRRLPETGTLAVGAAALAGQRANAEQPENVTAGERGASASDPGPENETLRDLNPNKFHAAPDRSRPPDPRANDVVLPV
jgi:hypothetical protein